VLGQAQDENAGDRGWGKKTKKKKKKKGGQNHGPPGPGTETSGNGASVIKKKLQSGKGRESSLAEAKW